METEGEKNPSEFIIKWDLLNVKQKTNCNIPRPRWGERGQGRIAEWISCSIHQSHVWAPLELPDISKNDGKTQFNLSPFYKG